MSNTKQDNPSAFKHMINPYLLKRMGKSLQKSHSKFKLEDFLNLVDELQELELKPRVQLVRSKLKELLPESYPKALAIILDSSRQGTLTGFDLWPYTDFIQTYGLEYFELSMEALSELTQLFTAEFAVRPFIIANPSKTYQWLAQHTRHENEHIRRWISEGTRPRLPWGEKIHFAIKDPTHGIALLNELRNDTALYVRKSVANHLNDIAKDHPDLVVKTLKAWNHDLPDSSNIKWITKHALRTLIKDGHAGALALIGVKKGASVELSKLKINKKNFVLPDVMDISFDITSTSNKSQKLVIDYIIHHVRANKELSPKVFKLKTIELGPHEVVTISKKHPLKFVTTRKYYPGKHLLEIQVNGLVMGSISWNLSL